MIKTWECLKCGKCCYNQWAQMELFHDEIKYFPKKIIKPYLGSGYTKDSIEIVLFKLIPKKCPLYDEKNGCTIYENRPRICKTFPFIANGIDKTCSAYPKNGEKVRVSPLDINKSDNRDMVRSMIINALKTKNKIWIYKKFKWRQWNENHYMRNLK